ncbi:MAG: biotin transporter BioY [Clostridia bacterium]|nr:biotin transporter BioY [Clostridia bacterium]
MKENALKKLNTRDMAYIALAVAVNAVCAFITIPATVPFTLQVFGIFFTLEYLGGRRGAIAVWLYLLMGAVGLPVFSGFRGGFSVLLSATGGFIMAFAAVALLYFVVSFFKIPRWTHYLLAAVSLALIYLGGSAWFVYMMGGTIVHALMVCVVPFILPDLIKIVLAFLLSSRLNKVKA